MPSFKNLGSNYVTVPLAFGSNNAGYFVRVVSTHDDTVVECNEMSIFEGVLAGEFLEFDYPSAHGATQVSCSHPCLVAQYTKEDRSTDNSFNLPQAGFMVVVTPEGGFSDDVTFQTPSSTSSAFTTIILSIVVFDGPVNDLNLNGVSLNNLDWQTVVGEDHVYALTEITPGMYRLYTYNIDNRWVGVALNLTVNDGRDLERNRARF